MVCPDLRFFALSMLTYTKCPINKNLIDIDLLEVPERAWVNTYHEEVYTKLLPLLANDPRATEWLKRETSPL